MVNLFKDYWCTTMLDPRELNKLYIVLENIGFRIHKMAKDDPDGFPRLGHGHQYTDNKEIFGCTQYFDHSDRVVLSYDELVGALKSLGNERDQFI